MNLVRTRWFALATIPVVVGLLLLVGLPKLSDLNPMTVVQRVKLAIKKRNEREPIQISQIVINPRRPEVVYAASHFYGMLKSVDRGANWRFVAKGLGTTDVYSMAMHPTRPETIFAATTGSGVYVSDDGGETWAQRNDGLTDTHVEDIGFDPADPETVYAATMREVFKSADGGRTWARLFSDNRMAGESHYMHTLLVARFPGHPAPVLFVGTPVGGFRRAEGDPAWELLNGKVQGQKLTVFAYDARVKTLFAGSLSGKFFASRDAGKTWAPLGSLPVGANWWHRIVLHPTDPQTIFAGSKAHGVFKSTDGGRTWTDANQGLSYKVAKALAVDPADPRAMYVGTPGVLATSNDGGATWNSVPLVLPPYDDVVAWLGYTRQSVDATPKPPPFWKEKCNECHGWTDPVLNRYPRSYWRVAPSFRDWGETVHRMGSLAKLTAEQKATVLEYLNTHFGQRS